MNRHKLLPQMIGVTLVVLLLAGGVAPVATPQPTPDRGIVAVVTMTDGSVFEVDQISVDESRHQAVFYYREDYTVKYLPLLVEPTVLEIPFDKLDRLVVNPEVTVDLDGGTALGAAVTLVDDQELQGFLARFAESDLNRESSEALAFVGRTTVAGYPAAFSLAIEEIASVTFYRDEAAEVSATVAAADGTVTENVSELEFEMDGGTTLHGTDKRSYVAVRIGATTATTLEITVEVTVADIQMIQREEDRFLVALRSGEKLEGTIPSDFNLVGRTTVFAVPAEFRSSFWDIQSVAFQ